MSIAVPTPLVPLVDPRTGLITQPWLLYLASISARPPAPSTLALTGSPFTYTASDLSTAYVVGGTVSLIRIVRGGVTVLLGVTSGAFLLSQGDALKITYTVVPTVTIVPA